MKLPEHYEKWVEDQASASHPFPTKSEWIEQCGDTLMTYEVGSYVEEAFESGAEAMYRKLMEDFAPAIEALEMLALGDWSAISGAETPSQLAEEVLAKLKEKGLVE